MFWENILYGRLLKSLRDLLLLKDEIKKKRKNWLSFK